MTLLRSLMLGACLLMLGACGSDTAAPSPATAASDSGKPSVTAERAVATDAKPEPAELPAEDLGEFRIVSVLLGRAVGADKLVAADSDVFARKDSIHASVLTTGAHQGLTISAKWLGPDGSTIAETEQPMVPTAAAATTFDISNPQGWPTGEYQVLIGVNKRILQTKKFEVR